MPTDPPGKAQQTAQRVRDLAAAARLDLSPERAALLVPQVEMIDALLGGLHRVALGETAPATAFSPRWPE